MSSLIYNTVGTIGVLLILGTYLLLQMERIKAEELRYSLLNLAGSSMILFSLVFDFNLPSFFVEIFWVIISVLGVVRYWQKRRALGKQVAS